MPPLPFAEPSEHNQAFLTNHITSTVSVDFFTVPTIRFQILMPRSSSASTRLQIRPASERDYPEIEKLVLESFEPITWARTLDEKFGPLNGLDWQARWRLRLEKIVADQVVLVGTVEDTIAAMSTSTVDRKAALAYIELLAVAPDQQGHGFGREMLRAAIRHVKELGAEYINLDCLTNNENANELYRSEGFEEVARHIRWFRKI